MPDSDEHAALVIRRSLTRLQRRLRAEGPRDGLAPTKLSVLAHLRSRGGPMTPGELATADGLQPQSLTRVLAELERDGLVARARDDQDARLHRITLTDRGKEALAADLRQRDVWLSRVMSLELSPAERRVLRAAAELMDRLADVDRKLPGNIPAAAIPVLPSHDITTTERFFRALGFTKRRGSDHSYLMVERDGIEVHYTLTPDVNPFRTAWTARLSVADADAFRHEVAESGAAEMLDAPGAGNEKQLRARWKGTRNLARYGQIADKPYRVREFALFDPTNNLLLVGHPIGLNRRREERRRS